jgi:protein disulfide-isomerase-like protein
MSCPFEPLPFFTFKAPWCGHCKQLAPILVDIAANLLETEGAKTVPVAKVDCTVQKRVCDQFQVQGYPTLKFFTDGKPRDYEGERSQNEIISFIVRKSGPPSKFLSTQEELDAFLAQEVNRVVAFVGESSELRAVWDEVASTSSLETTCVFGHADASLRGARKEGAVELHLGAESESTRQVYVYDGPFEATAIWNWILENGYPLVDQLSQESWTRAQTHPASKVLLTVFYKQDEDIPPFV